MSQLSAKEREILNWISKGKTTGEIAEIMDLSASTIAFHYQSVVRRYGTTTRAQTVVEAIRRGDIQLEGH